MVESSIITYYPSVLLLPFLSFIFLSIGGRFFGIYGAIIIANFCLILNVFLSINIYGYNIKNEQLNIYLNDSISWLHVDVLNVTWNLLFDSTTILMLLVVNIISMLVHIYTPGYLWTEAHLPRFLSYLSLFTFFMLILITSSNFLQLFLGWEGVGLCSYLLISFWSERIQANKAAIKAMIVNRIADIPLAMGIILIFDTFNSLDYHIVFNLITHYQYDTIYFFGKMWNILTLISILLFIGAMGKSAQIGLHTWLPDAMEGPTPVSALIHAATMVTAGVYLIIRCSIFYEYAIKVLVFICVIGSFTAFFGASTAASQFDLKKIIAYSTCSQLGYMIFCCGLSEYIVSFYHLTNHAFFKALLFLGAGAIIHALSDEQDIRKMGGLISMLPYTYSVMLIGSLALIGFPFMAGFYSKDIIIELSHELYILSWKYLSILTLLTIFYTAYYSTRSLYIVFLTPPNGYKKVLENAHDVVSWMGIPLFFLSFASIFSGYLLENFFIGIGSSIFFKDSIFILPINYKFPEFEILASENVTNSFIFKIHPLQLTLIGCFVAIYIYKPTTYYTFLNNNKYFNIIKYKLLLFLNQKWFFDKIYNQIIVSFILRESYNSGIKAFDKGILEFFGPHGIIKLIYTAAIETKKAHSGYVWHYVCMALIIFIYIILSINVLIINFL